MGAPTVQAQQTVGIEAPYHLGAVAISNPRAFELSRFQTERRRRANSKDAYYSNGSREQTHAHLLPHWVVEEPRDIGESKRLTGSRGRMHANRARVKRRLWS